MELTHLDPQGRPRMVDIGAKPHSRRTAIAEGFIRLQAATIRLIRNNGIAKGNVLVTAELAGVLAAKRTEALIPLCHPLLLTKIHVAAALGSAGLCITSEVTSSGPTGVEMEALTAV